MIKKCIEVLNSGKCSMKDMFALLTRIRQVFSSEFDEQIILKIVNETSLLAIIEQALKTPLDHGEVDPVTNEKWSKYFHLEALWILSNLSFGPCLQQLYQPSLNLTNTINQVL